jgi:hypothetical protein
MADLEISKHTKNLWKIITGDGHHVSHPIWHKVREVALEIFIIVFAVSLSIWMHGLGEHRHEQQQVKAFLLGLKQDLKRDVENIDDIVKTHRAYDASYRYLVSLDPSVAPDPVKFEAAYVDAQSNYFFTPQTSRHEGFKSSGKLTDIENEDLQGNVVGLYQQTLPDIRNSEGGWEHDQTNLQSYLESSLDSPTGEDLRFKLFTAPKGKRLCKAMLTKAQLYERYQNYIARANRIIKAIDQAYPES